MVFSYIISFLRALEDREYEERYPPPEWDATPPPITRPAALNATAHRSDDPPPPYEDEDERNWIMNFNFVSNPEEFQRRGTLRVMEDWSAELTIETSDLPGVMKHGLFLGPDNVQEEEGYLKQCYSQRDKRWFYIRHYTVVDSRWSGSLEVSSWDVLPLNKFRLHHLSADKIRLAAAEDEEANTVYQYNASDPEINANYIYDDMPMEGLWPWPREGRMANEEGGENDGEVWHADACAPSARQTSGNG
ncbi:hypothetical protein FALBO_14396 [Fusarium albosuccineum]|uniref:Uncharacterized protein n=1 Tax=Fusarium albosuccineum TaxID=1237068 RepID=A0A8H4PFM6_9HYPO|nr:hypothetical protein FALBO_14396 [Fusarium albosuccineum]